MSGAALLAAEAAVALLMVLGSGFVLVAAIGLVRLPDTLSRLHAPTIAATTGIGALVLAAILHTAVFLAGTGLHLLLVLGFVLVTAPVGGVMLAKAHLFRTGGLTRPALPPTGGARGWATFDAAPEAFEAAPVDRQGSDPYPPPSGTQEEHSDGDAQGRSGVAGRPERRPGQHRPG